MDSRPCLPYGPAVLRIVGTGAVDAPPSVVLSAGRASVLFNCGEGTQRLCMDHKIRVRRITHVAATSLSWSRIGGLPGMLLTLADSGLEHIHVAGPGHTAHALDATRYFVQRNDVDLAVADVGAQGATLDVPIAPPSHAPADADTLGHPPAIVLKAFAVPAAPELAASLPDSHNVVIRAAALKAWSKDKLSAAEPAAASSGSSASAVGGHPHRPSEDPSAPLGMQPYPIDQEVVAQVLADPSKRFFPAFSEAPRVENPAAPVAVYVASLPATVGRFNAKAAIGLGVRPGPLFKELQLGASVTLDSGAVVRPEQVMDSPIPGPVVVVLECPHEGYAESLATGVASSIAATLDTVGAPAVMVHITPPQVFESAAYRAFLSLTVPDTSVRHVILDGACASQRYSFLSATRAALKLAALEPSLYPVPWRAESQAPITLPEGVVAELRVGALMDTFQVAPASKQGWDASAPPAELDPETLARDVAETLADAPGNLETRPVPQDEIDYAPLQVTFLGTGAALPSKYRNVSGTWVDVLDTGESPEASLAAAPLGSFVLDCGEGTLGQVYRRWGPDGGLARIRSLAFVFISHMHADHHLGLISIIRAHSVSGAKGPLPVIGPEPLGRWLAEIGCVQDNLSYTFIDICAFESENSMAGGSKRQAKARAQVRAKAQPAVEALYQATGLGLESLVAVPVDHCYLSYGCVVSGVAGSLPWRVVFSGDCRPSDELAQAGAGATILIHEATFEDELESEAIAKKHATTGEAAGVGADMDASAVLLNHFSQRYPKIPVMDVGAVAARTALAFDLMSVAPHQVPLAAALIPHLQAIFDTPDGDEEEDA